ncbi:MAG: DUF3516 domain-containing protein [Opitutaceae bacterium]|nr:DUF3516 domain-containing protein [Opitutaceae bacterium]
MPPSPPLAPPSGFPDADRALDAFLAAMTARGLELYPEQEEAILELYAGRNVILNTPTGSGKSLVAAAFHYKALCTGRRSVYTCPIKALVNEKFLSLCRDFGPDNVGMMTGDATVNGDAAVLCCTAEILANIALAGGERSDAIGAVIMDEFHYYSDVSRGVAWQVPLLLMPRARFLLMSATLGTTDFIAKDLTRVTAATTTVVRSDRRPVPLNFEYSETPLAERVAELLTLKRAPVYLVHFTQREASEAAQSLTSLAICSREEKEALARELEPVRFTSPYGKEVKRWLRHGIGVHHAGLLPKYRILVEQLAQKGLLKVICGTDTLGVGINVPIRTVVFTQLWKYDGQKPGILSVRDFRQIAGRAGRKGFDDVGYVIVQAPEHVIANKRAEEKAASDPKKAKKLVKQKAPEGSIGWDEKTFERLMNAPSEALVSRFDVTHGMLLNVLGRDENGCRVMQRLIGESHEPPQRKRTLRRKAWQLFRSLLERGILAITPPAPSGRRLQVNVDLQSDFSLHQALSLYLIDTLPRLNPESPEYALEVLTLCESILEDPEVILRRQVDKAKTEELERLKAADVPYEQRMEKLEEIEHPKPIREFLYETFNAFSASHPWVGQENVRPKAIAREVYERYMSFSDYVREYGLQRAEGVLLRHLSQAWKVLSQTVPDSFKTEEVLEMETHLRELVRSIDSSLIEEWEKMRNPNYAVDPGSTEEPRRQGKPDITRDQRTFKRLIRTAILQFLQACASRDWETAAALVGSTPDVETGLARELEQRFEAYWNARGRFKLDPEGRSTRHTHFLDVEPPGSRWEVAQMLIDPEGNNDWELRVEVDIDASRAQAAAVIRFLSLTPLGQ